MERPPKTPFIVHRAVLPSGQSRVLNVRRACGSQEKGVGRNLAYRKMVCILLVFCAAIASPAQDDGLRERSKSCVHSPAVFC